MVVDRFVGRRDELTALQGACSGLRSGGSSWAQVVGEPGIGKTRLLGELSSWAEDHGTLVLAGRGAELERDLPFGVLIDALDDHLGTLAPEGLEALCAGATAELARVLPSVARLGVAAAGGSGDARPHLYRAMRRLVERLGEDRPLALVLDDLHWADPASVELVAFLLRRPPTAPVLLVLAWRPGQAVELASVLGAAGRDLPQVSVRLGPLDAAEHALLLGPGIDPDAAAAIYLEGGGNPFYLGQLARARRQQPTRAPGGAAPAVASAELEVPEAVASALAAEIAAASPLARRVAEAAAVAGEPFAVELAAAIAALDVAQALEGIDELVAAEVLRPTECPLRFQFRHPIVRRSVYASTAPGWRLAAHGRAASALAKLGAPLALRAHHVLRSARYGDRQAAALVCEAAAEVKRGAPATAARWCGEALDLLPGGAAGAPERFALLVLRASALWATGDLKGVRAALDEALDLTPPAPGDRTELVSICAAAERGLGDQRASSARLEAAIETLPPGSERDGAVLSIELAISELSGRRVAQATASAARAVAMTEPGGFLHAAALSMQAFVAGYSAAPGAAALVDAAAAGVDALGDGELALRPDAALYLGGAEWALERYRRAADHLGRARDLAADWRDGRYLLPVVIDQARVLSVLGRLAEAAEAAEQGLELARLSDSAWLTGWALGIEARVRLGAGQLEQALTAGAQALQMLSEFGSPLLVSGVRLTLALSELELGEAGEALRHLEAAGAPELGDLDPSMQAFGQDAAVQVALARGDVVGAERAAERASAGADRFGPSLSGALAQLSNSRVLLARGRSREAADLAGAAATGAALAGAVVVEGRARTLAGEAWAAAGDHSRAAACLQQAVEILAACGADRYRDEAVERLARPAPSQPGLNKPPTSALTAREHEVAALVVAARTNRQIAAELFVSEKTVESHMARIFEKLGVTSRTALAMSMAAPRLEEESSLSPARQYRAGWRP